LGLPSSHSLRLIPCYGLRPRWTHITSQCPRTPCYIPRPEDWTNGGVNAAFRHTDNVGFQNHQNFGAYNLHLSIVAWYPLPPASHQPVTRMGAGFGSEVVANLSSGWIFTSWRVWIYLGTPVYSVVCSENTYAIKITLGNRGRSTLSNRIKPPELPSSRL